MDLTMTNDGPTALYIGGIDLQGSDQWTVVERPDCLGAPNLLEPGASCTVSLVFVPTGAAGPRAVTAYLVDGSSNHYAAVSLSGYATARSWVVVPSALTYVAPLSSAPVAKSITVTNNGTAPLVIDDAVIDRLRRRSVLRSPSTGRPASAPVRSRAGASCDGPGDLLVPVPTRGDLRLGDGVARRCPRQRLRRDLAPGGPPSMPFGEYTRVTPARVFDTRTGAGSGRRAGERCRRARSATCRSRVRAVCRRRVWRRW